MSFTSQGAGFLAGKGQRCQHLSARAELPIPWDLRHFQGFGELCVPQLQCGSAEGQCVCEVGAAWSTDNDGSATEV